MRLWREAVLAAVVSVGSAVPVPARAQLAPAVQCGVENAQVSVSFNGMDMDVALVRSRLDAKIAEVKALVAEQHFTKVVLQSFNYSINTNYNGGDTRFQFSGSVSFSLLPADKAVDFMELLAKKGYQSNVNVNSYNNGSCSAHADK